MPDLTDADLDRIEAELRDVDAPTGDLRRVIEALRESREQNTALAVRVQEAWAIAEVRWARLTEATQLMLAAAPLLANPGDRLDLVRAAGRLAPSEESDDA